MAVSSPRSASSPEPPARNIDPPSPASSQEFATPRHGAFMEPSGRNRWQPVTNAPASDPRKQAKSVAVGCNRLPLGSHGKEGVDGSSPSEGLAGSRMVLELRERRSWGSGSDAPLWKRCGNRARGGSAMAPHARTSSDNCCPIQARSLKASPKAVSRASRKRAPTRRRRTRPHRVRTQSGTRPRQARSARERGMHGVFGPRTD